MTDKELQESFEAIKRRSQRDIRNLKNIYYRKPRPRIENCRDFFIYSFDILIGELVFDWYFPYLKLGIIPQFLLVAAVLLAYDQEYQLMSWVILLYLFSMDLLLMFGLFLRYALTHPSSSDSDNLSTKNN